MSSNKEEVLEIIRAAIRRTLDNQRPLTAYVELEDLVHYSGLSMRRVTAVVRNNAQALGGRYIPSHYHRGNPREFNVYARQSHWIPARLFLDVSIPS